MGHVLHEQARVNNNILQSHCRCWRKRKVLLPDSTSRVSPHAREERIIQVFPRLPKTARTYAKRGYNTCRPPPVGFNLTVCFHFIFLSLEESLHPPRLLTSLDCLVHA